jgi:hypothetical protein
VNTCTAFKYGKTWDLVGQRTHTDGSSRKAHQKRAANSDDNRAFQFQLSVSLFYSVSFCVMFQCNREVATLVELAKGGGPAFSFLTSLGFDVYKISALLTNLEGAG